MSATILLPTQGRICTECGKPLGNGQRCIDPECLKGIGLPLDAVIVQTSAPLDERCMPGQTQVDPEYNLGIDYSQYVGPCGAD